MSLKIGKGKFLWAIGGKLEDDHTLNDTTVYNVMEDKWYSSVNDELTQMPHAVQGAAWTYYEGEIYCFGGKTDVHSGCSAHLQVYNIENDEWRLLEEMPEPRSKLGKYYPVVNDKYVYIFGGDNKSGRFSRVNWNWRFDLDNQEWNTEVTDAPFSQSFPFPTYHDDWLYYSTGNTQSKGKQNNYPGALNQRYNPKDDEWQVVAPAPHPVTDGSGDKFHGELHFLGGWNTNHEFYNPKKDHYRGPVKQQHLIYNYSSNSWRYASKLPARWHHGGARASEKYLWRYLGTIDEEIGREINQFENQVQQHTNKIFKWDGETWEEMNPAPIAKMNFGTVYTEIGPKNS